MLITRNNRLYWSTTMENSHICEYLSPVYFNPNNINMKIKKQTIKLQNKFICIISGLIIKYS